MNLPPLDTIITGDCRDVLAGFPENSVDMIFADPPYNLQLANQLFRPDHSRVDAVDDAWDLFQDFDSYDRFTFEWLKACRRVLKETGTIWIIGTYHNIYRVGTLIQDLGFWILNDVVWIKDNPMPNFHGVRFTNAHETLIWAQKNKGSQYTFNYQAMKSLNDALQMRSDWYMPICTGNERIKVDGRKVHSTQKPEALLYRIILACSNPGDVILDPFFGTGTTGAVAKRLNRHYLGIEYDPTNVCIARERIELITSAPPSTLNVINPRKQKRIPFGNLLEAGLLEPGQILHFVRGKLSATILADGSLQCGELTGSIHHLARILSEDMPANGWDCWLYENNTGAWVPINELRDLLRSRQKAE